MEDLDIMANHNCTNKFLFTYQFQVWVITCSGVFMISVRGRCGARKKYPFFCPQNDQSGCILSVFNKQKMQTVTRRLGNRKVLKQYKNILKFCGLKGAARSKYATKWFHCNWSVSNVILVSFGLQHGLWHRPESSIFPAGWVRHVCAHGSVGNSTWSTVLRHTLCLCFTCNDSRHVQFNCS